MYVSVRCADGVKIQTAEMFKQQTAEKKRNTLFLSSSGLLTEDALFLQQV